MLKYTRSTKLKISYWRFQLRKFEKDTKHANFFEKLLPNCQILLTYELTKTFLLFNDTDQQKSGMILVANIGDKEKQDQKKQICKNCPK